MARSTRRTVLSTVVLMALSGRLHRDETIDVAHASEVAEINVVQHRVKGDPVWGYRISASGEFAERVSSDGTLKLTITDDEGNTIATRNKSVSGTHFEVRAWTGPFAAKPRMVEYRVHD